jgi:hypothetical protein
VDRSGGVEDDDPDRRHVGTAVPELDAEAARVFGPHTGALSSRGGRLVLAEDAPALMALLRVFILLMLLLAPVQARAAINVLIDPEPSSPTQVYRNQKYGYELRYPVNFTVQEGFEDHWKYDFTSFLPPESLRGMITISHNGPNRPSSGMESRFRIGPREAFAVPPPLQERGTVMVDGIEAAHLVSASGRGEMHIVSFMKDGVHIEITGTWGDMSDFPDEGPVLDYTEDRKTILAAYEQVVLSFKSTK